MALSFVSFQLEILDRPFVRGDGFSTPQTAKIKLLNEKGQEVTVYTLAIPNISEIYEAIGRGDSISLDSCYVNGFSLSACRRYLQIDKTSLVPINNFSACNAFFTSMLAIDFTLGDFRGSFSVDSTSFVAKELNFHGAVFTTNALLFSNCFVKAERFDMAQCSCAQGEVNFKNTIFDRGVKDFQDIAFGDGDVVFTNTEFGDGDVSFINARFNNGDVSFKVARFGQGKVDFHYAKFGNGSISFEQAEFGDGRTDFRTVEFGTGRTSFNRSVFGNGEVTFEGAQAKKGKVTFKRATFGNSSVSYELFEGIDSDLVFERSTFNASVSFRGALIKELHLDECQFNSTLNLHVDTCHTMNLTGCVFRDIVEYWTHGEPPKVSVLNLSGVRLLGILYIDWESNNLKRLIYSQTDTGYRDKAEQFRVLKQNFNNSGQYDDEDLAYVEFKRNEAKAILRESIGRDKKSAVWQYPAYGFKKLVFDWMGLYATSPVRVVVSNIVIYFLFALVFTLAPYVANTSLSGIDPDATFWTKFWNAAYYTGITYFTVGYGDILPIGWLRLVADLTAFIGVFMMSYFTVAFVRKILR
jgi:hypothetical protein